MSSSVVVKLVRPYQGRGPGELMAMPETAAASLFRKGIAVRASADLVALYRDGSPRSVATRQPKVETAMAADAPEMAVERRSE
jgi:hypothetical protein